MITAATHLDSTQLRLRAARRPFYAGTPDQTTNGDRAERHCRSPTTVRRPSLRIFTQTRGAENQYRRGRVRLMRHCYQMGLSVLVVFYFARHDKRKAAPRRPQARRRRSTTVAVRQTSAQRVGRRGRIWFKTENKNGPIAEGVVDDDDDTADGTQVTPTERRRLRPLGTLKRGRRFGGGRNL